MLTNKVIIKIITLLPINDRKSLRTTAKNFKTTIDLHNLWLNEILNKSNDNFIKELKKLRDEMLANKRAVTPGFSKTA